MSRLLEVVGRAYTNYLASAREKQHHLIAYDTGYLHGASGQEQLAESEAPEDSSDYGYGYLNGVAIRASARGDES